MEQFFFEFNETVIQLREKFTKNYNKFLDSALFWKISIVAIPIYFIEYSKFYSEINLYLGYIYSTTVSYTHLDVYKRQKQYSILPKIKTIGCGVKMKNWKVEKKNFCYPSKITTIKFMILMTILC